VLGHLHLSGSAFLAHMALPGLAAAGVTAGGRPDVRHAGLLGLVSVPLALTAAVGLLVLGGAG
jgi:hypothetical protein